MKKFITNTSKHVFIFISFLVISVSQASSPYVDKVSQSIKSLSTEEIQQILNGEGMGYALAAELNNYPGPKHVLELKDKLALTPDQLDQTNQLFSTMQQSAKELGQQLVEAEAALEAHFQSGAANADTIQALVNNISVIDAKLRGLHLSTHVSQKDILSQEQNERYQTLRGYNTEKSHSKHDHSKHNHSKHSDSAKHKHSQ
jgi:Spy/CpxP family protein refolding chaperone